MTWFRFQILISEGLRKRISSSLRYLFLSIPFPHLLRKSWVKYAQDLPAWQTDACKWVCSHTSPLSAHPGAQLPSILGQPVSLLRFHVRMLLKLILSLSSRSSFSQRSQAATGTGEVSQLLVFMKSTRFLCLQDPHPFI